MEPKHSILIVDDDSDIREMIALLLSKSGYGYETAANGREALAACRRRSFDVILLDIMMPQCDGYTFCTALREINQRCYIIYITALDGPDVLERALLLGGDDFIRKPFEPRELLARIASCVRRLGSSDGDDAAPESILLPCGTQIHPDKNIVLSGENEIHLTPIEMGLLCLLVRHPEKPFTYGELYETVWERPYLNDKGTVATFISAIKKKLKEGGVTLPIQIIWGEGYYYQPL